MKRKELNLGQIVEAGRKKGLTDEEIFVRFAQAIGIEVEDVEASSLNERIAEILLDLGVPAHLNGYSYLVEGICYQVVNGVRPMMECTYPHVAKKFGKSIDTVEHRMRTAIEAAWDRGNQVTLEKYFGYTTDPEKGKPCNAHFIAEIAYKLRREGWA